AEVAVGAEAISVSKAEIRRPLEETDRRIQAPLPGLVDSISKREIRKPLGLVGERLDDFVIEGIERLLGELHAEEPRAREEPLRGFHQQRAMGGQLSGDLFERGLVAELHRGEDAELEDRAAIVSIDVVGHLLHEANDLSVIALLPGGVGVEVAYVAGL